MYGVLSDHVIVRYNGIELESVDDVECLGHSIRRNLKWCPHIDGPCEKISLCELFVLQFYPLSCLHT